MTKFHHLLLLLVFLVAGCQVDSSPVYQLQATDSGLLQPSKTIASVSLETEISTTVPASPVVPQTQLPTSSTVPSPTPIPTQTLAGSSNPILRFTLEPDTFGGSSPELVVPNSLDRQQIYLWSTEGVYSRLNFSSKNVAKLYTWEPTPQGSLRVPGHALDFAFSPYSQQIAYLTRFFAKKGEPRELWVSDVELQGFHQVWVDNGHWLGDLPKAELERKSQISWGPDDRYIIITSFLPETMNHLVVYDQKENQIYQWVGDCDLLVREINKGITLWCELEDRNGPFYAALDADGVHQSRVAPTNILSKALTWRFSPDGKKVLYLMDDFQWHIAGADGKVNNLPVFYTTNHLYTSPATVNSQWSYDGERVLVYGKTKQPGMCHLETGQAPYDDYHGCWIVLELRTNKIIWQPSDALIKATGYTWENTLIDCNAALSPDGRWLAINVRNGQASWFDFFIVSLDDQTIWKIPIAPDFLPGYFANWVMDK